MKGHIDIREARSEHSNGLVNLYLTVDSGLTMPDVRMRMIAVAAIVVVISLLMGSFGSLAAHRPDVGRASWTHYEGFDGSMEIGEEFFVDSDRVYADVFTSKFNSDGSGNAICDSYVQEGGWFNHYDYPSLTRDGDGEYFMRQLDCGDYDSGKNVDVPGERNAPFNIDSSGYVADDGYHECVVPIGYIILDKEDHVEPVTYDWISDIRLYVQSQDHGANFKDYGQCWTDDSGMHWIDILLAVGSIGSLLAVGFFIYRKRSASTQVSTVDASAEGPHTNEQETNQSEDKYEDEAESPVRDKTVLESEKEQDVSFDSPSMFCSNCGKKNEIGGKFCKDCGTTLT